jgi:hypothetical protein
MFNRFKKPMPLVDAILSGNIHQVRRHLETGVDPNQRIPGERAYPLHYAAHSYVNIIKLLIEYGADVNVKDESGQTPLLIAATVPYLEGIRVLIENGADVNAMDNEGNTPLKIASQGTPITALFSSIGVAPDEDEIAKRKVASEYLIAHGAVLEKEIPTPEMVMQETGLSEDELTRRFMEHLIQAGKDPFKDLPSPFRQESEQKYPDLLDLVQRKFSGIDQHERVERNWENLPSIAMLAVQKGFTYSQLVNMIENQAMDKELVCLYYWGAAHSQEQAQHQIELLYQFADDPDLVLMRFLAPTPGEERIILRSFFMRETASQINATDLYELAEDLSQLAREQDLHTLTVE